MEAGPLKAGGLHQDKEGSYSFVRGAMRNSLVVAAFNLTDNGGGAYGGLALFPGSHSKMVLLFLIFALQLANLKSITIAEANLPLPPSIEGRFNGAGSGRPADLLVPSAPAGSVALFSEAL